MTGWWGLGLSVNLEPVLGANKTPASSLPPCVSRVLQPQESPRQPVIAPKGPGRQVSTVPRGH